MPLLLHIKTYRWQYAAALAYNTKGASDVLWQQHCPNVVCFRSSTIYPRTNCVSLQPRNNGTIIRIWEFRGGNQLIEMYGDNASSAWRSSAAEPYDTYPPTHIRHRPKSELSTFAWWTTNEMVSTQIKCNMIEEVHILFDNGLKYTFCRYSKGSAKIGDWRWPHFSFFFFQILPWPIHLERIRSFSYLSLSRANTNSNVSN